MCIKSAALTGMKDNLYVPYLTQYCSFAVSGAQATEQSHYNGIHHRFPDDATHQHFLSRCRTTQ